MTCIAGQDRRRSKQADTEAPGDTRVPGADQETAEQHTYRRCRIATLGRDLRPCGWRAWAAIHKCWADSYAMNADAKIRLTTVMTLIMMFIAGPVVSLKGSPTVSPMTAA